MRRILGALVVILLLGVLFAPFAAGEAVASGEGRGAGWSVTVGGIAQATLVPDAVAVVPNNCPAAGPCENHDSEQLLGARVGPILSADAAASLLRSEADAYRDASIVATLDGAMDAASAILPAQWNTRGYGRAEGFSALGGAILADTIEAEAVSGTRDDGGTIVPAVASGARIVNLRLAGVLAGETLADILPGQVNQELLNVNVPALGGNVRIVFWETNWNPATASTPGGVPVWVNTLRITAPGGIDIAVAQASATSTYVAPPPPPNQPPTAVDDDATTPENTPVDVTVVTNDTDPDGAIAPSTVTIIEDPDNGSVVCNNAGVCTYTPAPGFTGTDTFRYRVCDDDNACDTATVTVTVTAGGGGGGPVNQPPVADDDTATTPESTSVLIDVANGDTDPEDGPLAGPVTVTVQPNNGSVVCSGGSCTYTPEGGFVGQDTFIYRICDSDGACDTATVTITVTAAVGGPPANLPPIARDDSASTNAGASVAVNVIANDADPEGNLDPTSVQVIDQPDNGSVICNNTGVCTYTPNAGFNGTDTFRYVVCDTQDACDNATVTITVNPAAAPAANLPPIAVDDSATTPMGNSVPISVAVNDDDRGEDDLDLTSVTVSQPPTNGAAICNDAGVCTYTPAPGFVGTDSFNYTICDTSSACDTATVTITVLAPLPLPPPPANAPPVASNDTATTDAGSPVTIPVADNDTDPEDDLVPDSVSVVIPPANGSATCDNGSCTYTPAPGFSGSDSIVYQICDGADQCDTATVVIVVQPGSPTDSPPVAEDDDASTRRGTPVPITVTQNDSDPDGDLDTSSVRVIQQPANGSVVCLGSTCTYTPDPGFTGDDDFIYEVCDATGACDTAVVTITVRPPLNGGGNGPGGPGPGDGEPGRDGSPSEPDAGPGDGPGGPLLGAPDLDPTLGGPGTNLPFTGLSGDHYMGLAVNLVLIGSLLLLITRRHPAPATQPARSRNDQINFLETPKPALARPAATTPDAPATVAGTPNEAPVVSPKGTASKTAKKTTAKKPVSRTIKPSTKTGQSTSTASSRNATTARTKSQPAKKPASTASKQRGSSTKKSTVAKKSSTKSAAAGKTTAKKRAATPRSSSATATKRAPRKPAQNKTRAAT